MSFCVAEILQLDRVIHARSRLCVLVALVGAGGRLPVRDLETATGLALDRKWRVLDDLRRAGLIRTTVIRPRRTERREVSIAEITPEGRARLLGWADTIEASIALIR